MTYRKQGWVTCICGKERYITCAAHTQGLADALFKVHTICSCKSCEMEHNRIADTCPEGVPQGVSTVKNNFGGSTCKLEYQHTGRCQPIITTEDWQEYTDRIYENLKRHRNQQLQTNHDIP
jgi:hypothetical protein